MASPNNDKRKSNSGEDNAVAIEEGVSIASSSDVGSVNSDSSDHDHSIHSTASSTSPFKEESRVISRYKLLTLIAITIAAAACGIASYFIVAGRQEDNFNLEFTGFASKVINVVQLQANATFRALDSLAVTITSTAGVKGDAFPSVTVPQFEVQGVLNNEISHALQVTFAPLVRKDNKKAWESYSVENQGWLNESLALAAGYLHEDRFNGSTHFVQTQISPYIYRFSNYTAGKRVVQTEPGVQYGPGNYAPVWQQAPAPYDPSIINFDLLSHPVVSLNYHAMWDTQSLVISDVTYLEFLTGGAIINEDVHEHPCSLLLQPVYLSLELQGKNDIAGILLAAIDWDKYYSDKFARDDRKITIYTKSSCGGTSFTYLIDGPNATLLGEGDLHDSKFDALKYAGTFAPPRNDSINHDFCVYELHVYPTTEMEDHYTNNNPILYSLLVVAVFLVMAILFLLYDRQVTLRYKKMEATSKRTNAIVSSLFPANVRDRILKNAEEQAELDLMNKGNKNKCNLSSAADQLKTYMGENSSDDTQAYGSRPIADLFPSATVMFADIVGFTAWSSVREPCQVFTLLETLYQAFDEIAKRRRVFKVETIGDCYVAVAGLPDPRPDHAVVMARFARDCYQKMGTLTRQLERSLGPDTGDLTLRLGLHSGPVTAGVLRGDKGRFQLFGDTVNTAARMESNGERDRIHISDETASLLKEAGKGAWLRERDDLVAAKGKGKLRTYWLEFTAKNNSRAGSSRSGSMDTSTEGSDDPDFEDGNAIHAELRKKAKWAMKVQANNLDEKMERLVDWNTDILARLLKQILARHRAMEKHQSTRASAATRDFVGQTVGSMVIDEVVEIIELPELHAASSRQHELVDEIELDTNVVSQLRSYIRTMASMYRGNPFHNFEHASHVTMSVTKLLSRIVAPSEILADYKDRAAKDLVTSLHDHTYGINSDPLTQFACVFAALIHDVDHTGLPNAQLVKEKAEVALAYKGKSVAEQNSVDIAWDLLMDPKFDQFRGVLCGNAVEMRRFRQLVVNSVMATDIMDVDLKTARNNRWNKAFNESIKNSRDQVNRKATIVIEHLIQASDVAHTMQHWHIYRKWNERLFLEMLKAYREGHAEKDPTNFWYEGEIGVFDFYIIPLAKKLKDCGVFGVSSDEYLNYAQKNRKEWEQRGQEIVAAMVEKFKAEEAPKPESAVSENTTGGESSSLNVDVMKSGDDMGRLNNTSVPQESAPEPSNKF